MADPATKVETTPAPATRTIEVDASMDQDKVNDILKAYGVRQAHTKAYNTIRRKAMTDLSKKYPVEYQALLVKHGAKPKS